MEGERYKKTTEIAATTLTQTDFPAATAKYCIFAPLDDLDSFDGVEVIAFLVTPDQLSGLFTLANFLSADQNAVIALRRRLRNPCRRNRDGRRSATIRTRSSACSTPSARPCVLPDTLSFAGRRG